MARRPLRRERPAAVPTADGPVPGSQVRLAGPSDIGTVIELRHLMFEAMGTPAEQLLDPGWRSEATRWLQLHLEDPRTAVVVATAGGAVVSCAMGQVVDLMPSPVRRGDAGGLLTNVATFPSHRRLGLSEACVQAVIGWFRECTAVEVVTLNATEEGSAMYERLGFEVSTFPEMRCRLDRSVAPEEDDA